MEKPLFYHQIVVRDNPSGIAFTCTIINASEEKIESLYALKKEMDKFGKDYGNLNVNGAYMGKIMLCYYWEWEGQHKIYKYRIFDKKKLISVNEPPEYMPEYMSDAVCQIN